ncbi:ADP-ribose pyrophosphatase YjhB (NUDIX family) [Cytobacillus firmus]|uniref:ADP-ribose pyrophosphatase YjhB (NUDIX family) n=2 Tax=Cytobacillus TaxID=2675230 RepID=A0A366JRC3_CYTFI|nr:MULTISPECIES: NUDIX hydrolase [Cytobacillus]RBP89982.1 ADP-ribose pyrophosphatase YjhB (NUDIX family) [Cytobacillus firmus]TDX40430.1 ADP-ribose pyrophosphatase YjhB (NUDIX family) [Cytobacillus oceanisediminis]
MSYVMDLRKIVGSRPLVITGASVIVLDKNSRLLLQLRKDNNCWGLAGGSLEPGETLEEVAKRELLEETGLAANDLRLFNIYSGDEFYYKYPHGDEVFNVITAYICTDYDGELTVDNEEVNDLRFFHVHEIPSNISPPDRKVLKEYINSI